jgi:hypothetical protein
MTAPVLRLIGVTQQDAVASATARTNLKRVHRR